MTGERDMGSRLRAPPKVLDSSREAERGSGEADWGSWAGCVEGESTCIGRGRGSMPHQTVEIDGRQNGRLPLLS